MVRLFTILLCCISVTGCAETAAMYNLPRFSPDGAEVYAVKVEGEEVRDSEGEPLPCAAPEFLMDYVVALNVHDGSERHRLSWSEIDWYRQATEGQWRSEPHMSDQATRREQDVEREFHSILACMVSRWQVRQIEAAQPFPCADHSWAYRNFDISPDGRYIVVEDHGSVVVYAVHDSWKRVVGLYEEPANGDWLRENADLLLAGVIVLGILAAVIISASESDDHDHHGGRRGGRRLAHHNSHH